LTRIRLKPFVLLAFSGPAQKKPFVRGQNAYRLYGIFALSTTPSAHPPAGYGLSHINKQQHKAVGSVGWISGGCGDTTALFTPRFFPPFSEVEEALRGFFCFWGIGPAPACWPLLRSNYPFRVHILPLDGGQNGQNCLCLFFGAG